MDVENIAYGNMNPTKRIKIACMADSPKLTTGFGNVANQIYDGFYKAGFDVYAFGMMDSTPDIEGKLPYHFWPCNPMDMLGHNTTSLFLSEVKPDIIFMLTDPGNMNSLLMGLENLKMIRDTGKVPYIRDVPIIGYFPVEGFPIQDSTVTTVRMLEHTGGKAVMYSPGMVEAFNSYYDGLDARWAYHGHDHAPFRPYSEEHRNHLRHISGLEDYFLVGSVGVNKRTKGFDTLIYTARCLKDMDQESNIKFYFHTGKNKPTMNGYLLEEMTRKYDVEDMILFKPEVEDEAGGNINSIGRNAKINLLEAERPNTPDERKRLFSKFGFIDRLNVLDLYVDASSIEGFGLPVIESMACGIPTLPVEDYSIRDELYEGMDKIYTMPPRMWTTWHTGVKLALIDPKHIAEQILKYKESEEARNKQRELGLKIATSYKWEDTQKKFVDLVKEVLSKEFPNG